MTFEEAKKILEKEGYFLVKVSKGFKFPELPVWEKQEVVEAKNVANDKGFALGMKENVWFDRQKRLKKEYEKSTKAPGPGEEQPKEKKGFIYLTTFPKADFYYKHVLVEGNPALKESATQFNDALLDEQAKEIKRLKKENAELLGIVERMKLDVKEVDINFNAVCKENKRLNEKIGELIKEKSNLKDQITVLNACKKHNDKIDRKQIKCLGKENARLNGIIHDKNEVIADLTHELKAKHKKYVWYKGAYDAAQQILNTIADYAAKHPDKKFSDQMVEENHPTEDKPEEFDVDEILERVRKALEEGHTVSIDYKD